MTASHVDREAASASHRRARGLRPARRPLGSSGAEVRQPDRAVHLGEGVRGRAERSIQPLRAGGGTTRPADCHRPARQAATSPGASGAARCPRAPGADGLPLRQCLRGRLPGCGSGRAAGLFEAEALPRPFIRPRGRRKCLPQARSSCSVAKPARAPTSNSTSTTQAPERRLSARRQSDLRRARRRAQRLGSVSCEVLSPGPGELQPLMDQALDVEAAGWKGRERTALVHDSTRQAFFRRYAAAASSQGILRVCLLRIGDRIAAMQVAVETGGRFWLLKMGYDERFARCSPGSLLLLETIRHAALRELRCVRVPRKRRAVDSNLDLERCAPASTWRPTPSRREAWAGSPPAPPPWADDDLETPSGADAEGTADIGAEVAPGAGAPAGRVGLRRGAPASPMPCSPAGRFENAGGRAPSAFGIREARNPTRLLARTGLRPRPCRRAVLTPTFRSRRRRSDSPVSWSPSS